MLKTKNNPKTIDDYIDTFPNDVQHELRKLRATVKKTAPKASEVISYQMPAFRLNKVFFFYAGFKNHYSIFVPGISSEFKEELAGYKTSKATINIPFDKPLPAALMEKIVEFAVKRDSEDAEKKKKKKGK